MSNRQQEILEVTDNLIQTKGYKGFSYADLSKALGITKASIHHHFSSKEELGIAYCNNKIENLRAFRTSLDALNNSAEKFNAYLNIFKSCADGKMCGINALQSDIEDMSDSLSRKVRQVTELELEILTEILTEGRARNEMRFLVPPYDQAVLISSALKGVLLLDRVKKDNYFEIFCNTIQTSIECNSTNNKQDV